MPELITADRAEEIITESLRGLRLPEAKSHKGENGKVLLIGGSELFHAASKWSLDVVSRLVDMVFYASVPSNNELIQQAKKEFWNGIVINREDIFEYIEEADCILIGPGMQRDEAKRTQRQPEVLSALTSEDWNQNTKAVVDTLLTRYPQKRWVIDAGALQMVSPSLLNEHCIVTPHYKELYTLFEKVPPTTYNFTDFTTTALDTNDGFLPFNVSLAQGMSNELQGATLLIKGAVDVVASAELGTYVPGGTPGLTKGGTGDVLAGLVAGLYATNPAWRSAVVASYINKKAGEELAKNVGPFFNASDLAAKISEVLWTELKNEND